MSFALGRVLRFPRRAGARRADPAPRAIALDSAAARVLDDPRLPVGARTALLSLLDERDHLRREVAELKRRAVELEQLADADALTGVLNRRAFVRELTRLAAVAHRHVMPATVIYLDLDGFKAINDRFGHAAGDAVLRHVASLLKANVRDTDAVGRIGGDEFAIAMLDADLEAAERKAYMLEQALAANPAVADGIGHVIGASFGASEIDAESPPEAALERADRKMYEEKLGGSGVTR